MAGLPPITAILDNPLTKNTPKRGVGVGVFRGAKQQLPFTAVAMRSQG